MTLNEMYDYLIEYGIANEAEISLVTSIVGDNSEAYRDILYVRTGYRTFESYQESEIDNL